MRLLLTAITVDILETYQRNPKGIPKVCISRHPKGISKLRGENESIYFPIMPLRLLLMALDKKMEEFQQALHC